VRSISRRAMAFSNRSSAGRLSRRLAPTDTFVAELFDDALAVSLNSVKQFATLFLDCLTVRADPQLQHNALAIVHVLALPMRKRPSM
jgi:hypothetical protein